MKIKSLIFLSSLLITKVTMAGWSSGGGELIRDKNNPWFLQNTTTVKYCVQIDEKNFGQTRADVTRRVQNAIAFWKRQLPDLEYTQWTEPRIVLGTQNFIEEKCSKNSDIVFQFGTLTEEQKKKLGSTSDIIGLTVRTDYDRVNLKGKGFIYFAPENGPLKPTAKDVAENMWSSGTGAALYPLIIHELGHIFGLQHSSDVVLMNEDFAEELVAKNKYNKVYHTLFETEISFKLKLFKFNRILWGRLFAGSMCSIVSPINPPSGQPESYDPVGQFFGMSDEYECAYTKLDSEKLTVSADHKVSKNNLVLGEMKLGNKFHTANRKSVVSLWYDKSQNVFSSMLNIDGPYKIDLASMYAEYFFKGEYVSNDGKFKKQVAVSAYSSGEYKVSGVHNGKIILNVGQGY